MSEPTLREVILMDLELKQQHVVTRKKQSFSYSEDVSTSAHFGEDGCGAHGESFCIECENI